MSTMKVAAAGRVVTAKLQLGAKPRAVPPPTATGRVPRVARLMALAIKLDGMLRDGSVQTQAELAAVAHVTRARVTQILNLVYLAPDIQDAVLHLPMVIRGKDPVTEGRLRPIQAMVDWDRQRAAWEEIRPSNFAAAT